MDIPAMPRTSTMKRTMPFIAAVTTAGILFSACVSDHAVSPATEPTVHSEIAPPDCTHFLKPLCNPNKTRWDTPEHAKARPITSLFTHGGRIYLSGGEWNANLGPCPIWSVNPASGEFTNEYSAATERIDWFREDDSGRLYAQCTDICERCPDKGPFFRREANGAWGVPAQPPPCQFPAEDFSGATMAAQGYAVHTWDLTIWKGRVFTAGYGIGWMPLDSSGVLSNATVCLEHPHGKAIVITNGVIASEKVKYHSQRFYSFLPFDDALFCYPLFKPNGRERDGVFEIDEWRFDEASGQFAPQTNLLNNVGCGNAMFHVTKVGKRLLYGCGSTSATCFTNLVLYSAACVGGATVKAERIDLGGMPVACIAPMEGRCAAVVTCAGEGDGGKGPFKSVLWTTSDGLDYTPRFSLSTPFRITCAALCDGAWFFGALGEDESGEDVTGGIYRCPPPSQGNVL